MYTLVDTHCHLNFNTFNNDFPEVLDRANSKGVDRILIPAIDLPTSYQIVDLCEKYEFLYAAVGIHPNNALTWQKDTLKHLKTLTSHPKVVALGEIGLDYYRDKAPQSFQKEILVEQLGLAASSNLPVIIHNRDAFPDIWGILSLWQKNLPVTSPELARRPGVLHSFSEGLDEARQVLSQLFLIGISGTTTFQNAKLRQKVTASLPLDCLLLETDAPFLSPHPFRGQRNEPAYIAYIAQKIAGLHQSTIETIALQTTSNANRLFAWRT